MSTIDTSVEFNERVESIAREDAMLREKRAELSEALDRVEKRRVELRGGIERACAAYIDQFDRDGDGRVTPMEILTSVFTGMFATLWGARNAALADAEHVVRAMFTADANGDAVVDLGEFTRAVAERALSDE